MAMLEGEQSLTLGASSLPAIPTRKHDMNQKLLALYGMG